VPSLKLDNYLRTYRKRSGFSQDELAYLLGAQSGAKVSRYERNGRQPSLDTALAYKAVFGAPVEQLFPGRFTKVRRVVRRRAAFLRRRLSSQAQSPAVLRQLKTLAAISSSAPR